MVIGYTPVTSLLNADKIKMGTTSDSCMPFKNN